MNSPEQAYINPQEHLSQSQLIRYEQGEMSGAEMQRVEQHLLDCDLCSEALEGLALLEVQETEDSIEELKERLANRISKHKDPQRPAYWQWAVAASVLLLVSSGLFLFLQHWDLQEPVLVQKNDTLAVEAENVSPPVQQDSSSFRPKAKEEIAEAEKENPATAAQPLQKPAKAVSGKNTMPPQLSYVEEDAETEIPVPAEEAIALDLEVEESLVEEIIFEPVPEEAESAPAEQLPSQTKPSPQTAFAESKELTIDLSRSIAGRGNPVFGGTLKQAAKRIEGKVSDASGNPLSGVNIRLKGSTIETLTDGKGEYTLTIPFADTSLAISLSGFVQKEIQLKDSAFSANILLEKNLFAQEDASVQGVAVRSKSSETAVSPPQPLVGWEKFWQYLKENQRYPAAAKEAGLEGEVELQFEVAPDGSLHNIQLLQSLGKGFDEEAIRLLKSGPEWQPAVSGNRAVSHTVRIKVPFYLEK